MNIRSINKHVKGGRIYIKAFPGAKSTHLNHFSIHVGINDTLRSKSSNNLNDLTENGKKVGKICHNHSIGKIFISEMIPSKPTNVDISNINKIIHELFKKIILSLLNIHR